jgi:hypothetical protein
MTANRVASAITWAIGDRALVWNAKTRKFEYAPVTTLRMIQ